MNKWQVENYSIRCGFTYHCSCQLTQHFISSGLINQIRLHSFGCGKWRQVSSRWWQLNLCIMAWNFPQRCDALLDLTTLCILCKATNTSHQKGSILGSLFHPESTLYFVRKVLRFAWSRKSSFWNQVSPDLGGRLSIYIISIALLERSVSCGLQQDSGTPASCPLQRVNH